MKELNPNVVAGTAALNVAFQRREPFRHLVIDDFFTPDYCAALLAQFPPFEKSNARNEAGELGNKGTVEKIRALGPAYRDLDRLIASREFLDWLSAATGIPGLLYDAYYFGGGTHENRHGQELDPHVDFNRHPVNRWHRRLNLIVYLNHDWQPAWGGALELHSDPRAPDDRVTRVEPEFNRCVVFETTSTSWHGFSRIDLAGQDRSRKSVALYFYSLERPAEEIDGTHSTIYVDRPLPERFQAGYQLSAEDVTELEILLKRRDQHLERLYRDQTHLQTMLERSMAALTSKSPLLYFILRRFPALGRIAKRMLGRPGLNQGPS